MLNHFGKGTHETKTWMFHVNKIAIKVPKCMGWKCVISSDVWFIFNIFKFSFQYLCSHAKGQLYTRGIFSKMLSIQRQQANHPIVIQIQSDYTT